MDTYSTYQAKSRFSEIIRKVRGGRRVIVTHHGTQVAEIRSRSIRFIYEIVRTADAVTLAEGETLHLVTDANRKVCLIPEIYKEKLLAESIHVTESFPSDQAPS